MNTLTLTGCTPSPLASYLKALGILRLVAEQADTSASGFWSLDRFHLRTFLDREALVSFFLERYAPTPILAPWNKDSGFYHRDSVLDALQQASHPRLKYLREAIAAAYAVLRELNIHDEPDSSKKAVLLLHCRNRLPEHALAWLDAAYILTEERPHFPPLLGTGCNDGRLDFTKNFHLRLQDVIDLQTALPTPLSRDWLALALFQESCSNVPKCSIGQFAPAAAGGPNAGNGVDAPSRTNPWDYVLMLEGAALYANTAVKRLETSGTAELSSPFCVRSTAAGYASSSSSDESSARCELWLPLWKRPATVAEIRSLLGEGRAVIGARPASDGFEFARAVITLGVDRGIESFQRYGLFKRNGESYFATPLDRVLVRRNTSASTLIDDLDRPRACWLTAFRSAARHDKTPVRITTACRRLENALFALCTRQQSGDNAPSSILNLLLLLGECEQAIAACSRFVEDYNKRCTLRLGPLCLRDSRWLAAAAAVAPCETILAASLASLLPPPLRSHLEPFDARGQLSKTDSPDIVWQPGSSRLEESLISVLLRRLTLLKDQCGNPDPLLGTMPAPLTAITAFLEGRTDDRLLERLIWSCACFDSVTLASFDVPRGDSWGSLQPPALYALLRFALAGHLPDGSPVPRVAGIVHRAAAGDGTTASRLAARRLRASGARLGFREIHAASCGASVRRLAAALLFPISRNDLRTLAEQIQPVALAR